MKYIQLIRVHQWVKNLFVFFPAFFAGIGMETENLFALIGAFLSFSMVASAVYILNDYRDIEKDKKHPKKAKRPLAAGLVSKTHALGLLIVLLVVGLAIGFFIDQQVFIFILSYFLLNVLYSLGLKKLPLVDVSIISIGFILRVFTGAAAVSVEVSMWLIIMTFLLSMLLALAKRRDDLVLIDAGESDKMRAALSGYSIEFINAAMVMMGSVTIVAYIMYTIDASVVARIGSDYLYLTSFFVVLGVLRYLQLTMIERKSGSPTMVLLKDLPIQIITVGWVITFAYFIYVSKG